MAEETKAWRGEVTQYTGMLGGLSIQGRTKHTGLACHILSPTYKEVPQISSLKSFSIKRNAYRTQSLNTELTNWSWYPEKAKNLPKPTQGNQRRPWSEHLLSFGLKSSWRISEFSTALKTPIQI